jgi:hypothetical protein
LSRWTETLVKGNTHLTVISLICAAHLFDARNQRGLAIDGNRHLGIAYEGRLQRARCEVVDIGSSLGDPAVDSLYAQFRRIQALEITDVGPDARVGHSNVQGQHTVGTSDEPARSRMATESGKAQFTNPTVMSALGVADAPGRYSLITMRSNEQFNTTIYGHSDRLRGPEGSRDILLINPDDMCRAGLAKGDAVTLVGDAGDDGSRQVEGLTATPFNLPDGCLAGYYPEMNPLIPLWLHDEAAKTSAVKGVPVRTVRQARSLRRRIGRAKPQRGASRLMAARPATGDQRRGYGQGGPIEGVVGANRGHMHAEPSHGFA